MTYTITNNPDFGSIEISFDGKPEKQIRDALKALKFRWHSVKKVWYGYTDEDTARAAINGDSINTVPDCTNSKPVKVDKDFLRSEFAKAWDTEKMIEYCVNKVAAYAVLPSGEIVTVDKESINTDFCFGESGYDADQASEMAEHARTSAEYFKRENMEHFNRWLDMLEKAKNMDGYILTIDPQNYTGQASDCKLRSIAIRRAGSVINDCGGSACFEELPGKTLKEDGIGREYRIATLEEVESVLSAYKAAAESHEKKVDAYLKRYGTSKVRAWTYWRDA